MVHAKSLRVIGQALEVAKVAAFELEKHGQSYVAWSNSLTDAAQWISRYGLTADDLEASSRQSKVNCSLCFSSSDISRLDSQGRKRRRNYLSSYGQGGNNLSQLLRTLGDHLDRNSIGAFHVFWRHECVSIITLPLSDLVIERTALTAEKLQQLSLHTRLRRSTPRASSSLA